MYVGIVILVMPQSSKPLNISHKYRAAHLAASIAIYNRNAYKRSNRVQIDGDSLDTEANALFDEIAADGEVDFSGVTSRSRRGRLPRSRTRRSRSRRGRDAGARAAGAQ